MLMSTLIISRSRGKSCKYRLAGATLSKGNNQKCFPSFSLLFLLSLIFVLIDTCISEFPLKCTIKDTPCVNWLYFVFWVKTFAMLRPSNNWTRTLYYSTQKTFSGQSIKQTVEISFQLTKKMLPGHKETCQSKYSFL